LQWLAQAADLFDDADAPPTTRIDVMTMTGDALRRVGDASHRDVLLDAGRLAERVGDGPRMATAAIANGRGWQSDTNGIDSERVAALEAALAVLGDADANTRALLLIRLAVENMYEEDPSRRMALADEAMATARAHDDPYTVANVLASRQNVLLSPATVEQRRSDCLELTRLADELGDPNLRFRARAYSWFSCYESCDLEAARVLVREAAEISRTLGQPEIEWIATWEEAAVVRLAGDLEASVALVERSHEIAAEAGMPDAAFFHGVMRAGALIDLADPASLPEVRALCATLPPHYQGMRLGAAVLEAATAGEAEHARRTISAFGPSPYAPWSEMGGPPDVALSDSAQFASVEAALGEKSEWTSAAYKSMDRWRGQLYGNIVLAGPTEVYMAAIAPLADRPDELDRLLDTALSNCERMRSPVLAMYARLFGACGLRLRDRLADRDRASRLVAEAIALGDGMGAGIARAAAENFPALTP
jgi:hypothetical protein